MKLSQGEKLILLALAAEKDGKEELDLDFIRRAIISGNTWALSWELSGIPVEDKSPAVAEETAEILGMWRYIERSVAELSEADNEKLRQDAYPFDVSFSGFDANHDAHFGVASFLIQDMERFDEFKERTLNSHSMSSLELYRRMLPVYDAELKAQGYSSQTLSAESLLNIVKAGRA